jgi:hypothetical protein
MRFVLAVAVRSINVAAERIWTNRIIGGALMKRLSLRAFVLGLCVCLLALCLCGCGAALDKNEIGLTEEYDYAEDESISSGSEKIGENSNRKVIEYITLDIETKTFDELVKGIDEQISELGGYIESSDISGNGLDDENRRYATYKIRIPSDKSKQFTGYISKNSAITRKQINTEDVTLQYVDIESRINALKEEKKSLEGLLASANQLSDVITVRDRLTDVIAEIESYTSKLRTLSNLVEYTTVTLNVSEVQYVSVGKPDTVWQRIARNLKNGFINVWSFLKGAFVVIISSLPYLLLIGAVGGAVFGIVKIAKKGKTKKEKSKEE